MMNGITFDRPIFVTGMSRSGTSMTAGIFHLCGAWGGMMVRSNPANRKGEYENQAIREMIIKPYLRMSGCDVQGLVSLPKAQGNMPAFDFSSRIRSVLVRQGYRGKSWFYKDSRLCLVWKQMSKEFPDAKWILVRREESDIIASCMKTGYMPTRTEEGWREWISYYSQRMEEMRHCGLDCTEIWPTRFIMGDWSEIKTACSKLGLEWKDAEVKSFIDPKLYGGAR